MTIVQTKARKWGNSLGVVIPKDIVDSLSLSDEDIINIEVSKPGNNGVLRRHFGICKGEKRSGQEIKDELRRLLHSKEY